MKNNLWSWTVLVASLLYCLLFWYSQAITDGKEMSEAPPVLYEEQSANRLGASSGMRTAACGIRI